MFVWTRIPSISRILRTMSMIRMKTKSSRQVRQVAGLADRFCTIATRALQCPGHIMVCGRVQLDQHHNDAVSLRYCEVNRQERDLWSDPGDNQMRAFVPLTPQVGVGF